eukprot:scaffold177475_cov22-Tisochrysis_lutea.AAC.1
MPPVGSGTVADGADVLIVAQARATRPPRLPHYLRRLDLKLLLHHLLLMLLWCWALARDGHRAGGNDVYSAAALHFLGGRQGGGNGISGATALNSMGGRQGGGRRGQWVAAAGGRQGVAEDKLAAVFKHLRMGMLGEEENTEKENTHATCDCCLEEAWGMDAWTRTQPYVDIAGAWALMWKLELPLMRVLDVEHAHAAFNAHAAHVQLLEACSTH